MLLIIKMSENNGLNRSRTIIIRHKSYILQNISTLAPPCFAKDVRIII